MNSLQICYKTYEKGYTSNRHSDKYFNLHEKQLKLIHENKIKSNFYEIKPYIYDPKDNIYVIITICDWFGEKLKLHNLNIIESRCRGKKRVKKILPKISHTSYGGKLFIEPMKKSIWINYHITEEIDCPGCKDCNSRFLKKIFKKKT